MLNRIVSTCCAATLLLAGCGSTEAPPQATSGETATSPGGQSKGAVTPSGPSAGQNRSDREILEEFLTAAEGRGIERIATLSWTPSAVTFVPWPKCIDMTKYSSGKHDSVTYSQGDFEGDFTEYNRVKGGTECTEDDTIEEYRKVLPRVPEARTLALKAANDQGVLLNALGGLHKAQQATFSTTHLFPPAENGMCNISSGSLMYSLTRLEPVPFVAEVQGQFRSIVPPDGKKFTKPEHSTSCVTNAEDPDFYQGQGVQRPASRSTSGPSSSPCEVELRAALPNLLQQGSEVSFCEGGWAAIRVPTADASWQEGIAFREQADGPWFLFEGRCRTELLARGGPEVLAVTLDNC